MPFVPIYLAVSAQSAKKELLAENMAYLSMVCCAFLKYLSEPQKRRTKEEVSGLTKYHHLLTLLKQCGIILTEKETKVSQHPKKSFGMSSKRNNRKLVEEGSGCVEK